MAYRERRESERTSSVGLILPPPCDAADSEPAPPADSAVPPPALVPRELRDTVPPPRHAFHAGTRFLLLLARHEAVE